MSDLSKRHGPLQGLNEFHKSRVGYLVFGLVELALSYVFINLAIPSGDWWEWLLTLICLFGALQNFGRAVTWRPHK